MLYSLAVSNHRLFVIEEHCFLEARKRYHGADKQEVSSEDGLQ